MVSNVSVLGSTGSIGRQTIDILRKYNITASALTTNRNIKLLEEQAREFRPKCVAAMDERAYRELKIALADTDMKVYGGSDGLVAAAEIDDAECVLTAVVGMVGLIPTIAAIDAGKNIALANKETLVCAGSIVTQRAKEKGVSLLPVDSEHSAIFQCMQANADHNEVSKILLTASGGPFFGKKREELKSVTVKDALNHPNWSMGSKITIDSATLMNKGLEFIEAMWLFGVTPEQIEVVVHRESIIHSMVEFCDGAVLAQLGAPDMRLPIAYALTYPNRMDFNGPRLDFKTMKNLTFATPDVETFSCLKLAMKAAASKDASAAVLNGANEAAVAAFLGEKCGFLEIAELVQEAMENVRTNIDSSLEDILEADKLARESVSKHFK
ncbi:MAG: 1-deoxy-D-xylulose-5-phosphate reductoisomerase [Clostridia bacterium]|nr:1-deoxy-D-xylulose-5-phosphate reductoisomerase [Clostridia bacterium]